MKRALIIGNGAKPKSKVLNYFLSSGPNLIVAADGGANLTKKINIIPDMIIGDMDSIGVETLKYYKDLTRIITISRQDDTDIEKAIKYLIDLNYDSVVLLACGGLRFDHSINNIGHLIKYYKQIKIIYADSEVYASAYEGDLVLETKIGETISLFGFDSSIQISSQGLKYPLNKLQLKFGKNDSCSNESIAKQIKLEIIGGKIILFRNINIGMKNGFIFSA